MECYDIQSYIGNFIIPTDFNSIIFQRGRYTTNQDVICMFLCSISYIYIYGMSSFPLTFTPSSFQGVGVPTTKQSFSRWFFMSGKISGDDHGISGWKCYGFLFGFAWEIH